eukprot:TRINITY_DN3920_c0_g1_i1.p1 TRINITY_DN3920_c0_g1~~TRINITY_DN3920_c0_g1_i1.p1  ORF type:complete len:254 (+),score=26.63 TRINITY_DN3920_c0_g1_i1:258-1019(+)
MDRLFTEGLSFWAKVVGMQGLNCHLWMFDRGTPLPRRLGITEDYEPADHWTVHPLELMTLADFISELQELQGDKNDQQRVDKRYCRHICGPKAFHNPVTTDGTVIEYGDSKWDELHKVFRATLGLDSSVIDRHFIFAAGFQYVRDLWESQERCTDPEEALQLVERYLFYHSALEDLIAMKRTLFNDLQDAASSRFGVTTTAAAGISRYCSKAAGARRVEGFQQRVLSVTTNHLCLSMLECLFASCGRRTSTAN